VVTESPNASLKERSIRNKLATRELGRRVLVLENCSSTNDVAAEYATQGIDHGFTVIAETQTMGKGRFRRQWQSPHGGIWMTIVLRDRIDELFPGLPLLGALAVVRALRPRGVMARVRWPNDVMVDGKKLAGVLAECKSMGNVPTWALLGIGINANFPSDELRSLATKSVTLLDILGSPIDRNSLVCEILLSIELMCECVFSGSIDEVLTLLRNNECSVGRKVIIETSDSKIVGSIEAYPSLTKVMVAAGVQTCKFIETASVVSVVYLNG
jgi:BirA family biotin operon repressor/biotin-[acetyl-CoA-carboxylase] ligase